MKQKIPEQWTATLHISMLLLFCAHPQPRQGPNPGPSDPLVGALTLNHLVGIHSSNFT